MIAAATIHLIIHWRWVVKVTGKIINSRVPAEVSLTQGTQVLEH